MPEQVIAIDAGGSIADVAFEALKGSAYTLTHVKTIQAAKRKLVQSAPVLILCAMRFEDDGDAGLRLCRELKVHPTLKKVPVILIADHLKDELIHEAHDAGAKALLGWPVTVDILRARMLQHAPQLASVTNKKITTAPVDEKLKLAQSLLEQVLHNLKTSDLLQVVELDDVPRILAEMTRSVCGFDDMVRGGASPTPAGNKANPAVEMDLDSVFGIKKPGKSRD